MKNKKNSEQAAAAETKVNETVELETGDVEDEIRNRLNSDAVRYSFKKSLYGYDIPSVDAYLDSQDENFQSICRVYDSKIKNLKTELSLSYRECNSIKALYESNKEKLDEIALQAEAAQEEVISEAAAEDKTAEICAEYENTIDELNSKLAKATHENERLNGYVDEVAELTNKNARLEGEAASLRQKVNDMRLELAKLAQMKSENDSLFAENTRLNAERNDIEKQLNIAEKENAEKEENIRGLSDDNDALRKEVSEIDIKRGVSEQKAEKAEQEVEKLREINKKQAYEYASKVNELESEYTGSKLKLQKQLQVHSYHIKQMEVAISELCSQFSEVKKSLDVTDGGE